MGLAQENFDRAVRSASDTLVALQGGAPELSRQSKQRLQTWMWDLEAMGAAIRLELMNREDRNPMDLG